MDMSHGGGLGSPEGEEVACKMSMLFNFCESEPPKRRRRSSALTLGKLLDTTDACFLTPQWRIRSRGDFVGSLGKSQPFAALLTSTADPLPRRLLFTVAVWAIVVALEMIRRIGRNYDRSIRRTYHAREKMAVEALGKNNDPAFEVRPFRPTFGQHFIRSTFYFVQFSVSYIMMLLGMYFNGAILFAIL